MRTIRKILTSLALVATLAIPTTLVAAPAQALSSDSRADVANVARKQVGDKYKYGKAGPTLFDCSGLVVYAMRHGAGKKVPHSSAAIRRVGKKVSKPRYGDIVYTKGHVSIFLGNGKVVEAASPGTRVRIVKRWQKNPTYLRF